MGGMVHTSLLTELTTLHLCEWGTHLARGSVDHAAIGLLGQDARTLAGKPVSVNALLMLVIPIQSAIPQSKRSGCMSRHFHLDITSSSEASKRLRTNSVCSCGLVSWTCAYDA